MSLAFGWNGRGLGGLIGGLKSSGCASCAGLGADALGALALRRLTLLVAPSWLWARQRMLLVQLRDEQLLRPQVLIPLRRLSMSAAAIGLLLAANMSQTGCGIGHCSWSAGGSSGCCCG